VTSETSAPGPVQHTAPPKTNTFALIGFIGVFFLPLLGIVFGVLAKRQIESTNEAGRGFAQWAFGLGIAGTAFQIVFFIVWLGFFITAISQVPLH
jgi:uncharacterized membrane protein